MNEHEDDRPTERIHKIMASAGLGSRRGLENEIKAGAIKLNDKVAQIGATISVDDVIEYNGQRFRVAETTGSPGQLIIYNKPLGELCTRDDPEGRRTVFDKLPRPKQGRWVTVGRLDINTTGLLLLTTDGELANALMHPSSGVDREYACRVRGAVGADTLQRLRDGVELEDGPAKFSDIVESGGEGQNHWYHVVILEGRNREVRRLWESQGVTVSRLKRVRYGPVFMPSRVKVGQWEELPPRDIRTLREDVKLKGRPATGLKLERIGTTKPGNKSRRRR